MRSRNWLLIVTVTAGFACGEADQDQLALDTAMSQLSSPVRHELLRVRSATAQYHDAAEAWADGFAPVSPCVFSDKGGMGVHYLNSSRVDGEVEVEAPEVLLYQPGPEGLRLVGVEYFVPVLEKGQVHFADSRTAPTSPQPPPSLFGRSFEGPLPGQSPGEPWHYALQVWIWRNNPDGLFEAYNPRVFCPDQSRL